MHVLVLNAGSSSLKYQLVDPSSGTRLLQGLIEEIGGERTYEAAIAEVLGHLEGRAVAAVGHRVVHGGERFVDAVEIDDEVVAAIREVVPLAPLHNPANLAGIAAARAALPNVPHVAVFDTAFHVRMPRRARTYAIDLEVSERLGLRRFGFHGTSHRYVSAQAAAFLERPIAELRMVTLHLGNGASACAVEWGHSVETSMGLTPLEGLVMGTRSGDVGPGLVLRLCRELGVEETDTLLNRKSGLAGLSGLGNDLRVIQRAAAEGDDRARLAINVFAHRARKVIGAYAAVMGGLDAVVLTGGIGEHSVDMRRRILQRLDFLGVTLDEDRNADARVDHDRPVVDIAAEHARVRALVVATNEELQIARDTEAVVRAHKVVKAPSPIPIAISARHVHLDRAAMDVLFGVGSDLTPSRPLSQPGQFASEERVTVVGPRGRLERVRVLGPLRKACQVEVSRTDEFLLGVDAPIRQSGQTADSAPVVLEGPKGTLQLKEGLICAWRHIHMHPDDALAFGVSDGDEVEVAVTGGPRDLVFGDVLVRVSEKYALEMHIDTDEANAAELSSGASGELQEPYRATAATGLIERRR
ncbi:MAG: acetate/propionate family kinase [Alphaproteobacteria bacterium]|nr:acetate/propionate family kinase [Alphaproteobacteria bacterium]MCB9696227.1 acetate/propionate family kinase [Alphaproteobacteria bacterium]